MTPVVCVLTLGFDPPYLVNLTLRGILIIHTVSSMAITLQQLGYGEGDVREKEIARDKGGRQRKKMVEEEQKEYRKLVELAQHFQIFWWRSFGKQHSEGGSALSQKN